MNQPACLNPIGNKHFQHAIVTLNDLLQYHFVSRLKKISMDYTGRLRLKVVRLSNLGYIKRHRIFTKVDVKKREGKTAIYEVDLTFVRQHL